MYMELDFRNRIKKIQEKLKQNRIDVVVGTKVQTLSYLVGVFMPVTWRGAIIFSQESDPTLIVMNYDYERVKHDTWIRDIRQWDRVEPYSFARSVVDTLNELGHSSSRIGIEIDLPDAVGLLSVPEYEMLVEAFGRQNLIDVTKLIDREVMVIKDKAEIEFSRRAAEIADIGIQAGINALGVGKSENYIAGVIEAAMRAAGSSWAYAETGGVEVGSGYRSSFLRNICSPATNKIIQRGDTVVIDAHTTYNLSLSDTSTTAVIGPPTTEQAKAASVWRDTALSVLDAIRPRKPVKNAAKAGLAVLEKSGYLDYSVPTFGHGMGPCYGGLVPPFIWEGSDEIFLEGSVISIFTCVTVPGVAGLRLEYQLVVTSDGIDTMNKFPIELIEVAP
jgi:Xaa-Pro aminopeptidase